MSFAQSEPELPHGFPPLWVTFGRTELMQEARRKLAMFAGLNVPVLLQGESGTGREMCSRLLHLWSDRAGGELVRISCAAIPRMFQATELFGHEQGVFPEATTMKRGLLEDAHGGTLVLDGVDSLDAAVQYRILQVLQEGTFTRLGGLSLRNIDTRIIFVVDKDLGELVRDGRFRLDFFHRMNAVTITLPPLRRRRDDLPELVKYFTEHHARAFQRSPKPLSDGMIRLMQNHEWPGNMRQLENVIRSYVLIGDETLLIRDLTSPTLAGEQDLREVDLSTPLSLKTITRRATLHLERQIILKVLQANNWNRQKTAKWLHISYRSLLYKLAGVDKDLALEGSAGTASSRLLSPKQTDGSTAIQLPKGA